MKPRSVLVIATIALATPSLAGAGKSPEGQAAQAQDPPEPARPIGFERRDIEDMDRRVEERQKRWRAEQALKAKSVKERKAPSHGSDPGASN